MPTTIVDDPTSFPVVTTPQGTEVPNAASLATTVQQLANRTANLNTVGPSFIQSILAGNWTKQPSGTANLIRGITGDGPFSTAPLVAVGHNASAPPLILTSFDGSTWTSRVGVGTATDLIDVAGSNSSAPVVAISLGTTAQSIQTSADGVTWTLRTGAIALSLGNPCIVYSQPLALFVIAQGGGTNGAETSPDGVTWTARTLGTANTLISAICWAKFAGTPLFIAAGKNSGTNAAEIWTSPDGTTWTQRTVPTPGTSGLVSVAANFTLPIGVTTVVMTVDSSGATWISPDGVTWTAKAVTGGTYLTTGGKFLIYTGSQWLAFFSGSGLTSSYDNGATWHGGKGEQFGSTASQTIQTCTKSNSTFGARILVAGTLGLIANSLGVYTAL